MTLLLLTLLCCAPSALFAQEESPKLKHMRVVWESKPSTEALVSWTTLEKGDSHTLVLDTKSHSDADKSLYANTYSVKETGSYDVGSDVSPVPFYHHVKLGQLKPGTRYYLRVESDGTLSQEYWFETAPDDNSPFKLLYGGDSRSDRPDRQKMNQRIKALFEKDDSILALWHGGDFVSKGYRWKDWTEWLDDHTKLTTTSSNRLLPVMPTRGNHEADDTLYNQIFGMPGGGEKNNYFVTKIGDATLITLDSETSVRGDQRDWLERTLRTSRENSRWLVAGYHTPAWPSVKVAGPAKAAWVPLFESYNVDLVCENDGHTLKRTVPIKNGKQDPDGIVYVGEGGLGVKQREPVTSRWFLQSPGMTMSAHHVQVMSFSKEKLSVTAVGMDDTILDQWERTPRVDKDLDPFRIFETFGDLKVFYVLKFTYSIDPDSFEPESITISPDAKIKTAIIQKTQSDVLIQFEEPLVPGQSYTVTLNGLKDFGGRPLENPQVELVGIELPDSDMGGEGDPDKDMGTAPTDMADDAVDMANAVDMSDDTADMPVVMLPLDMKLAPKAASNASSSGCSSLPGEQAPNHTLWLLLLAGGLFLKRRRRS